MTNRTITKRDIEISSRINELYNEKKGDLNLSQITVATKMNVTQSAISQQLNGKVALTTDNVLAWASVLEVHPSGIDPELHKVQLMFTQAGTQKRRIAVLMTLSCGVPVCKCVDTEIPAKNDSSSIFGIEVDTDAFEPYADRGDVLIIDMFAPIRKKTKILVRLTDEMLVGRYLENTGGKLFVERLDTGAIESRQVDDILSYSRIISVVAP